MPAFLDKSDLSGHGAGATRGTPDSSKLPYRFCREGPNNIIEGKNLIFSMSCLAATTAFWGL
jgi:hypothetical protein